MKRAIVTWMGHHVAFALVGLLVLWWLVAHLLGPVLYLALLGVGFALGWTSAKSWGVTSRFFREKP
jgi:hypothetical protein